jgi:hypothetical protein
MDVATPFDGIKPGFPDKIRQLRNVELTKGDGTDSCFHTFFSL